MKRLCILLSALLAAAPAIGPAHGQTTGPLASAKAIYEKSLQKIEEDCLAKAKEAPAQYERKLDELGASLQKSGDLDALLAVNKEKARFKTERSIPETSPADLPAVVIKLQEEHRAALAQFGKEKSQKIVTLTKQYLARLEIMKKDLTAQGKLDDAVAARDEIKRAESSEAYANAQKDAPADEAKPAEPETPKQDPAVLTALKKGLVLHYSFDKDEGTRVTDLSGKNNHGRVHRAKWIPKGLSGGAFDFDGTTSYINVGYDPKSDLFPTKDAVSICAWFRTAASEPAQQVIVGTHKAGAGSGYILCVDNSREAGGGRLLWLIMDGTPNGNRLVSKVSVNDGVWHHVAAIWSGDQMLLYADGVLQGARGAGRTVSYPHQADFRIGHTENINAHGAFDGVYYLKGQVDEVRVYSRALGEDDVASLFQLQSGGRKPAPPTVVEARPPTATSTTSARPGPSSGAGKMPRIMLPGGGGAKYDAAKLYQRAVTAVVVVAGARGHGSGFSIGRKDIILTNAHVVQNSAIVKVFCFAYEGEKLKRLEPVDGEVIYRSDEEDIAVVKFEKATSQVNPLPVARKNPTAGAKVYALGSPGLGGALLEQTITEGIVSSGAREFGGQRFLQHTAAVNPGNSGGPLLNEQGEVVGMITLKAFLEGVSFAIPAEKIRQLFEAR